MDYRIVEKDSIKLIAKVEQFPNEIITAPDKAENTIPEFWQKSMETDVMDVLRAHAATGDLYGPCAPFSKDSEYFDYGIGMLHDGSDLPEGYRIWELKSSLWAVFPCRGEGPEGVSETWGRIHDEFEPQSDYRMLDETDFEFYPEQKEEDLFCEIWVPVKKKD